MSAIFGKAPGLLADLEVISQIGRGAETVVYRVRLHGNEYALRVLHTADPGPALAAVRREAALLGCLGNPLLPRIFEVGEADAGPYLILEHVDGPSLSQTLRHRRLDEDGAVRLAIDLVEPLSAAHSAGLVHRDIKPDNVVLGPDGTARLIDFGLAARSENQADRVTGTSLYSAPEQTGVLKRPVDGRSDLYALGILLFECVTGQVPYNAEDTGELIHRHATSPIPDVRTFSPEVSDTLAEIVATLMAKDPDDRYQSGESLLADLRRLAAHPVEAFAVATDRRAIRPTDPPLLVGRDQETARLSNRWLEARSGSGGAVIVEGAAGAGKTRLVRELTDRVAADGGLVLYGKCVPDDPVPLAPLRAAVERYLRGVRLLPAAEREVAVQRLRRAAGRGGPLLRTLSPLLADLVESPDIGDLNRHEQFVNAVAAFLVGIADEFRGAVLHIDDVQWLDGPTRRVFQQMTSRLSRTPLLVLATGRDDPDCAAALDRFGAHMGATLDTRVALRPMDRASVVQLVGEHLGAVQLPGEQVAELAVRAGGNPFTVGEYVRAVLDAGLITPSWDGWQLDLAGLDSLDLSGDAVELVLQRINSLGPESRSLLTAGAAGGRWFPTELVARVCGIELHRARAVLTEAELRRLVIATQDGYRFLHDWVRDALLVGLDPASLRHLHQCIAEVLDAAAPDDPRFVYATARHYALGETDDHPQQVYLSGLAAGRLALAEHAPAEAYAFLEVAARSAEAASIAPQPSFFTALGTSCARTGRFEEALGHLDRALHGERDGIRRADILAQTGFVHLGAWSPDRAFETVRRGLSELGTPLPRNKIWLALSTLASVVIALAVGRTRLGFGRARADRRERFRLQAVLYDIGASAATMRMRRAMRALMSLRALYPINRLGPGPEYARHMSSLALIADVAGRPKLAARLYDRAASVAATVGDPELVGYVEWKRGAGSHLGGRDDDGHIWARSLVEHERWLTLGDYLTGVSTICIQLFQRGHTAEAEAWYLRGKARLGPDAQAEGAAIGAVAAAIAAQLGRPEEATAHIDSLRRFLRSNPDNPTQLINLYGTRMIALIEQDDLGEAFDRLTAEFAALGLEPMSMVPGQRVYYVYEALGRLTLCHRDGAEDDRTAAAELIARLDKMADTKTLRAFHRVAHADLEVLSGRPQDALRDLAEVDVELLPLDAPLIAYEAARTRARAFTALGLTSSAGHQAKVALLIATDQQWPQRARWVRDEFRLGRTHSSTHTGATVDGAGSPGGQRLQALQRVSLASATVLEPRELTRAVLDETVRILGAERAFVFLLDLDRDQLVPHAGRDAAGNDIQELTGYDSTLVDRVRRSAEPVVVNTGEDGGALGPRSIMVAPLEFDGHVRGVAYLDGRTTPAMFTDEDLAVVIAVADHIAASLETRRAAQLEIALQAARGRRDVADALRAALADQSSSLDPDEVMRRLLESLSQTLGGYSAVLLTEQLDDQLVVTATQGNAAPPGTPLDPVPSDLLGLAGPRVRAAAQPFAGLLGSVHGWCAIPLTQRGESFGVVLVGARNTSLLTEPQAQIAAAIAGQGMMAHENARLLKQVQVMATVDALTGLYTRRHFFLEVDRQMRTSWWHEQPTAAAMVDVDHFKDIIDTYGHPVGDEVVQAVAERLRKSMRGNGILGRYGGDAFALVTPLPSAAAAELAARLRQVVSGTSVPTAAGPLKVTVSVGLAHAERGGQDPRELLARAGEALQQAKQTGRDLASAPPAGK